MKLLADTSNWIKGRKIQQSEDTRYISNLNGTNQYYKFAKTVVGDGAGTFKQTLKVSDIGASFKLADGDDANDRFYINSNGIAFNLPAGLTATVNEVDNVVQYGELCEVVITGDFTGLKLATLFAHYSGNSDNAKVQPFYISYEDQSQSFEYDFTKAISDYILPEGFEFKRNIVTENQVSTWDGTEADWSSKDSSLGDISGKIVWARIKTTKGSTGRIRLNGQLVNSDWVYGGDSLDVILTPGTYLSPQTNAGENRFIGTAEIEIREVPNALMLQGASANLADDFEEMVQRGDGHWLGLKNYFGPSNLNVTWSQEGKVFTKNSNAWGGMGELPSYDTVEPGDWSVSYTASAPNLSVFTKNAENTANNAYAIPSGKNVIEVNVPTAGLWFDSTTASGVSLSQVKFNKLFKLSNYLLKRYQIEQVIAAIAAYKAKNKNRYITSLDAVDDYLVIPASSPIGDFDYPFSFVLEGTNFQRIFESDDGLSRVMLKGSEGILTARINGDTVAFSDVSNIIVNDRKQHSGNLARRGNTFTLTVDGVDGNPVTVTGVNWSLSGACSDVAQASQFLNGGLLSLGHIDHESPLPIGQGGKSFFMSLDDAPGTIAANKLGVDKKGNIVVKDGAGLSSASVVDFNAVTLNSDYAVMVDGVIQIDTTGAPSSINPIKWMDFPLDPNKAYMAFYKVGNLAGKVRLNKQSDGATNEVYSSAVGLRSVYLGATGGNGNVEVYVEPDTQATIESLVIFEAYGYGEWQGLPADFSTTKLHVTEGDGSRLAPAVLAFPANSNLGTALPHGAALVSGNTLTRHQASSSYRGLPLFANSDSNKRVLFSGEVVAQEGVYVPIRIQGTYPDRIDGCFNLETGEWSTQPSVREGFPAELVAMSVALTNAGTVVFSVEANIDSTVANVLMYITAAAANGVIDSTYVESDTYIEFVDLLVSHQERLPLSTELQRQHDLDIVEKQIDKQLKKAEKSQVVVDCDGLDDAAAFPALVIPASTDFELGFWACHDGSTQRVLGRANSTSSRVDLITGNNIRLRCSASDVLTTSGKFSAEGLYAFYQIIKEGEYFHFYEAGNLIETVYSAAAAANEFYVEAAYHSNMAVFYGGFAGPFYVKSISDPLISRFYVHNPDGYLEDLLHPDGSMDGTYIGMPANFSNIQQFKKSGDDLYGVDKWDEGAVSGLASVTTYWTAISIEPGATYHISGLPDGVWTNDGTGWVIGNGAFDNVSDTVLRVRNLNGSVAPDFTPVLKQIIKGA